MTSRKLVKVNPTALGLVLNLAFKTLSTKLKGTITMKIKQFFNYSYFSTFKWFQVTRRKTQKHSKVVNFSVRFRPMHVLMILEIFVYWIISIFTMILYDWQLITVHYSMRSNWQPSFTGKALWYFIRYIISFNYFYTVNYTLS